MIRASDFPGSHGADLPHVPSSLGAARVSNELGLVAVAA